MELLDTPRSLRPNLESFQERSLTQTETTEEMHLNGSSAYGESLARTTIQGPERICSFRWAFVQPLQLGEEPYFVGHDVMTQRIYCATPELLAGAPRGQALPSLPYEGWYTVGWSTGAFTITRNQCR